MAKADLTAQRLRELFYYDPNTGDFTRLTSQHRRLKPGTKAGYVDKQSGYIKIGVDHAYYKAHRLAWLYMTGQWPSNLIDHINGDPSDNRFCNLRDVTTSLNMQNKRRAKVTSSTGVMGVCWSPKRKVWQAQIGVGGKQIHLGRFATAEEAHASYIEAKRRLHPGCTI